MIIFAMIIAILITLIGGFWFMEISFNSESTLGTAIFGALSYLCILLASILFVALCVYVGFLLGGGNDA